MKIAVLGAGAMGSIFGGWLSRHHEVWLIDIWQGHVDAINTNGLLIEEDGQTHCFQPRAVNNAQSVGPADLVIIFVKSINTATALAQNRKLFGPQTLALTLQNGWGNADDIRQYVGVEHLYLGTTAHGGNVLGPGRVCHAGSGPTFVGVLSGDPGRARPIADCLTTAGFATEITDNVTAMIWKKLLINAAINPLTALLNVRNGFLAEAAATQELVTQIVREAVTVANARGMTFDAAAVTTEIFKVAWLTAANRSSMLQDVTQKRRTEIDRINGAIVTQGEAAGIATPYNTVLLQLIKALEERY
ncbi:MAG: 2-dehydropantoate 2-reductase [Bacillota bacterium]